MVEIFDPMSVTSVFRQCCVLFGAVVGFLVLVVLIVGIVWGVGSGVMIGGVVVGYGGVGVFDICQDLLVVMGDGGDRQDVVELLYLDMVDGGDVFDVV